MIIVTYLSAAVLCYFIIVITIKWKKQPISLIIILMLLARILGLMVFLYITKFKVSKELVQLRFMFDDISYILLLVLLILAKKQIREKK